MLNLIWALEWQLSTAPYYRIAQLSITNHNLKSPWLVLYVEEKTKPAVKTAAHQKKRSFGFVQHPKCVVCGKTAYPKESIALNDGQRVHTGVCLKVRICLVIVIGKVPTFSFSDKVYRRVSRSNVRSYRSTLFEKSNMDMWLWARSGTISVELVCSKQYCGLTISRRRNRMPKGMSFENREIGFEVSVHPIPRWVDEAVVTRLRYI